jgi:hypothetical protein
MALSYWWRKNRKSESSDFEQRRRQFLRRWKSHLRLERLEERVAPATLSYAFASGATDPRAVTLRVNGANLEIIDDADSSVEASLALSSTSDVSVTGANGKNDQFTINFASGDFFSSGTFTGGITFAGNGGDTDTLFVNGSGTTPASDTTANYAPSSVTAGNGIVTVATPAADPITSIGVTFSGLTAATSGITVHNMASFTLTPQGSSATLSVLRPTAGQNQISGTSGKAIAPVNVFSIPAITLDASATTASDSITIGGNGLAATGLKDFTVKTGSAADTFADNAASFSLPTSGGAFTVNTGGGADTLDFSGFTGTPLSVSSDKLTFTASDNSTLTQSGTPAEHLDITLPFTGSDLRTQLTNALDDLLNLINKAQTDANAITQLTNSLPFLGELTGGGVPNLSDLLKLNQTFQDLKGAVNNALNGLGNNPKLSDVVTALNGLTKPAVFSGGGKHLTFASNYRGAAAGTTTPDQLEALIDIDMLGSATDTVQLETGADAKQEGIDLQASVGVTASISGLLDVGITTDGTLTPFLVPDRKLTFGVSATANFSGSKPLNLGILALTVGGGASLLYSDGIDFTLQDNGDSDARITASDLSGSLSDLVSVTPSGSSSFSASVPVTVNTGVTVVGFDLHSAGVTLTITLPDGVFGDNSGPSAPHFDFAATLNGDTIDLNKFGNVSTNDLLGMLGGVLDAMSGLGKSAVLSTPIPFTGKTVGDVVDLASSFKADVLDPLFKSGDILHPDFNGDGATDFNDLYFSSIQSLAQAITAELGLGSLLAVNYDSDAKELTFSLNFDRAVGGTSIAETTAATASINEIQTLTIPSVASGGLLDDTFRLAFPGSSGELEFTSPIALHAADTTVRSALEGLSSIDSGDVSVVKTTDTVKHIDFYAITFAGGAHPLLQHHNVPMLVIDSTQLALGLPLDFGTSLGDIASVKTAGTAIMAAGLTAGLTFGVSLNQSTKIEVTPPIFQPDNQASVLVETTTGGTANLNEVQVIHVNNATGDPLDASSSYYTLWFDANNDGVKDPSEVTGNIAFGAPASGTNSVQSALVALASLNSNKVSVTGGALTGNDRSYTVTFQNGLAHTNVAQLVGITTDNSGKPTLKGPGQNGVLSGSALIKDINLVYNPAIAVVTTQPGSSTSPVQNEQQTVTLLNTTGGQFKLSFGGQTTGPIDRNAPATGAGSVEDALNALSSINSGGGSVSVTGSAGGPYTIAFDGGPLVHANVAQITADAASLVNSSAAIHLTNVPVTQQTTNKSLDDLRAEVQQAINAALITAGKSLGFDNFTTGLLTNNTPSTAGHTPMSTPLPNDLPFIITVNPAQIQVATTTDGVLNTTKEVQTVALTHATGGTFKLAHGADTTGDISFTAKTDDVKSALEALPGWSGKVDSVSLSGTTYTITFSNTLGNVSQLVADGSKLTSKTVNGSVRKFDADTNGLTTAIQSALNGALSVAGVSGVTVDVALDSSNIQLTPHGANLNIQFRSPITVDSGGGRISISASPITIQVSPLGPPVNDDGRVQVMADFTNRAYQEMGLLTSPTRFDGNTSQAMDFTLVVNGTEAHVTLPVQSGHTNIGQLVDALQTAVNSALSSALIDPHAADTLDGHPNPTVLVYLVDPLGNRIGFRGRSQPSVLVNSLAMNVVDSPTNGAITDLGFEGGNGETHKSKADGFFLENVGLDGHFQLAASGVTATASLGFLGITATGGGTLGNNKFLDLDVSLGLKNPVDGSTRLGVTEIAGSLKNGFFLFHDADKGGTDSSPTTGVVDATVSGGVGFHLDVTPSTPLGGVSALDATLDLTSFSPNWLTATPSLADPLGFGTDNHDLSSTPVTLAKAVPGNGHLSDSVTFVVSDGTHNAIVFVPFKSTSAFSSADDLRAALQTAVNDAMSAASVSGSVTVGLSGGKITLATSDSGLSARGPIAFSGPDVQSLLDKFRNLSFDDIIAGLKFVVNYLRSLDGSGGAGSAVAGALNFKIPLIDKSVADLVDMASAFADRLSAITNNPSSAVQDLNKFIDGLFGLPLTTNVLSYNADDQVLGIEFDLNKSIALSRPFDLDLQDAGLPSYVTNLVSLSASGSLNVNAGIDFDLKLGMDLSGPEKTFFIETGATGTKLHAFLDAGGNN